MKNSLKIAAIAFSLSILFTFYYSYTSIVDQDAQANIEHFDGSLNTVQSIAVAGVSNVSANGTIGNEDLKAATKQTFFNGLISAITLKYLSAADKDI
ncbi:hypothetical protein PXD56_10560 [Maribacter sp. SA7]|uniref:hypothetical protein n=1 Tax=Maribacter zhoushanensis TaxID=3030012 RepID=UPI0023EB0127|nr:hypothetical protein [Maribacter zhoushanensis]MDF4203399.1 hypothetical protein [Maribacter zhoushanensis]